MARWILVLLITSLAASGCGVMEDFVFGPDPYYHNPPAGGCGAPVVVNTHQTNEPELNH